MPCVPQFLIGRDPIPFGGYGERKELEFTINEEGTYAGQCAFWAPPKPT